MDAMEDSCSLESIDWEFYTVYKSKHNKESIGSLKSDMTCNEFAIHQEYVEVMDDMDYSSNKDQEIEMNRK